MKKLSLTTQIIVFLSVFVLAVNLVLSFILMDVSKRALRSLIYDRMLDISNTAAAMLDGDTLRDLKKEDRDTPEYRGILDALTVFQENIDLDYIYTVRSAGDGQFVFAVDPTVADPGEFGAPVKYTDALYIASLGTPAVDEAPYEDAWGRFYSAYSPVFASDGAVAGIVAVDISAAWYDNQVSRLVRTSMLISVLSMLAGAVAVLLLTDKFRKDFRTLYTELNTLSEDINSLIHEAESSTGGGPGSFSGQSKSADPLAAGSTSDDINMLVDQTRSMQQELRDYIHLVQAQAYMDGMTGVGNKTAYLERIKLLEQQIEEGNAAFSVAVFDLNGLKSINDSFGHQLGDLAITDVSGLLKLVFGPRDVYRVGGDEFIAVVTGGEPDMAELLRRLDEAVADFNRNPHPYQRPLTISKGAAAYLPGQDTECRAVFRRADEAMYQDKANYYLSQGDRRRR